MSACQKTVYGSKADARRCVKWSKRAGKTNGKKLSIYWCEACGGFHLTSKPRRAVG